MNSRVFDLNAQQTREAYIQEKIAGRIKASRSIIQKNLPSLEFPDALPNDEGIETNLIPTNMLSEPVTAVIRDPWQGGVPAEVNVFLNDNEARPIFSQTYTTLPTFPLEIKIDPSDFASQGVYNVRYRVQTRGAPEDSDNTVFTVDREDPNRNNEPKPLELDTDRLNLAYLQANNGLPFTIPAFDYPRPGDYCIVFMKKRTGLPEEEVFRTPARPVAGFDPTVPTTGIIPLDKFIDANDDPLFPDGTLEFSYLATSRAGNEAKRPEPTFVQMAFLPEPSGLQLAVIPLATEASPLIDRADAILGVTVQIREFQNWQPTDKVVIRWGTRTLPSFDIGPLPSFPLESAVVAYPTLKAEGSAAGEGPKSVEISYTIVRGLLTFTPPGPTSTSVDLRIPGPENPDPGPENPALGKVTVLGGGASPEANKIRVEDKNKPITVTLPLLSPPLPANDVLEVIWNGKKTGATYKTTGGETDDYSITVPYDVVDQDGPAIPVQMSLTSGDPTVPPDNVPVTVATPVEVNTFEIGTLIPPTFPDKVRPPFNSIGCNEKIWEGARFKVEGDAVNFAANDTVTVHWEGHVAADDDTLIPDTKGSHDVQLTAEQAAQGFEHHIPFTDYLDKVADAGGIMVAWYHLTKSGVGGKPSDEVSVYPSYTTPSGCKCTAAGICRIAAKQ